MNINPKDVVVEMATGTSFVCAMCHKYWEGKELRERGEVLDFMRTGQRCTARGKCGSPLAGDVFSEYEGPLVGFENFCFVCGKKSVYGIRECGIVRVIGVCADHFKWFDKKVVEFEPHFKEKLSPIIWKDRELLER